MGYRIINVVDATEVPDWERKPTKWSELADEVLKLDIGKSLEVEFDDYKTASRARNAVRDMVNLRERAIVVRTRLQRKGKGAILYFTRIHPVVP